MQNKIERFIKGKDNLNLLLENYRATYKKDNLSYKSYNNVKKFDKIFHAQQTPKCKTFKGQYLNKNGHITPFFIKEIHERKYGYPPSYVYKRYHEHKMKNMSMEPCFVDGMPLTRKTSFVGVLMMTTYL